MVDNLKSKQGMRSSNMQATAATAYVVAFGTNALRISNIMVDNLKSRQGMRSMGTTDQ